MLNARKIVSVASAAWLLGSLGADAQTPPTEAQMAEGHRLSLNLCAACHIVSADQMEPPVLKQPTPFFYEIANNPQTTPQSIETYLSKAHWDFRSQPMTMPQQDLSEEQRRDIVAYIMSLRR